MVSNELAQSHQTENKELKQLQQLSFEATSVENPKTLQEYANIAKMMAASGYYPEVKNAFQAVTLMILGRHFGLSPVQSLTAIHIVKGKPMLHYSAILAKVREHPDYDYRIVEHTEKACKIEFSHKGQPCGESIFTEADAKRQGTQNMDKHGKTMLLARAASNGVKWYCPDVLNGMPVYVQGEIPDDAHVDGGMSKRDHIKAELEARRGEAIDAETVEASTAAVADLNGTPGTSDPSTDGYSGPVVKDGEQKPLYGDTDE